MIEENANVYILLEVLVFILFLTYHQLFPTSSNKKNKKKPLNTQDDERQRSEDSEGMQEA